MRSTSGCRRLAQKLVWETGLETSYGLTAIAAMVALFAALFAVEATWREAPVVARALSLAALLVAGFALALSGHASNAAPQWLTRPSVFVHVVCVAFWVGALLPLHRGGEEPGEGARAGAVLAAHSLSARGAGGQRRHPRGGAARSRRRALDHELRHRPVVQAHRGGALLALGAANRYVLVPRYVGGDAAVAAAADGERWSSSSSSWPRSSHWSRPGGSRRRRGRSPRRSRSRSTCTATRAMAQVSLAPVRARDPRVDIEVLDGRFQCAASQGGDGDVRQSRRPASSRCAASAVHAERRRSGGSRGCAFRSPGNGSCASIS